MLEVLQCRKNKIYQNRLVFIDLISFGNDGMVFYYSHSSRSNLTFIPLNIYSINSQKCCGFYSINSQKCCGVYSINSQKCCGFYTINSQKCGFYTINSQNCCGFYSINSLKCCGFYSINSQKCCGYSLCCQFSLELQLLQSFRQGIISSPGLPILELSISFQYSILPLCKGFVPVQSSWA